MRMAVLLPKLRPMDLTGRPPVAALLILSVPLWWILGLDQAVWLAAGLALGVSAIRSGGQVSRWFALAAGLFFVAMLVSGLLGAQGIRWITFARDVLIVGAFFMAIVGASAAAAVNARLGWLLIALASVTTVSVLASIVAFALRNPFGFDTILAPLIPDVIASTRLGEVSLTHRVLGTLDFFVAFRLLRPQGLFLFSTSQAVALAVAIPLFMAAAAWRPGWRWPLWMLALGSAVVMAMTTTRGAMFGLLLAGVVVWLTRRWVIGFISIPLNRRSAMVFLGVAALLVAGGVVTGAARPITQLVTARSFDSRTGLYAVTVERWADRPLLGWGTEVDFQPTPRPSARPTPSATPRPSPTPTPRPTPTPESRPQDNPPLGSHSQYLGVLFKQGIVGTVLFAAFLSVVAAHAVRVFRRPRAGTDWLIVAFGASLVAAVTESLWLDPATAVFTGICWGLILGFGRSGVREAESGG